MLVIFECANNHGGSVDLGKRIIDKFSEVAKQFPQFRYAFKWQYRDLPSFIHPTADPNHKYVKRFRETNLSEKDRITLKEHAEKAGFLTACTPFDEKSVRDVVRHGYNIMKVGSPSFSDWGLWYEIKKFWHGPIIASCGGATEEDIDRVVEQNRGRDLTLMHCVSEYPTKRENLQLGQIKWIKDRYHHVKVGFSSHYLWSGVHAVLLGLDAYERHVGLDPLPNKYSLTPEDMSDELEILEENIIKFGESRTRVCGPRPTQFMRRNIDGMMWWKPEDDVVEEIMALIKKSGVVVPKGSVMCLSHHYGLEKFKHFGAAVIECFNMEDYAKKILVMLPGQYHEEHKHLLKHETFHVLYGDLFITAGGKSASMIPGDTWAVPPGTLHKFTTDKGCVFEEISTHQHPNDSVYTVALSTDRKTKVREF